MTTEKEKEVKEENSEFIQLNVPRSKVDNVAKEMGYDNADDAMKDANFITRFEKYEFEQGRKAKSGEFNKMMTELGVELGMEIKQGMAASEFSKFIKSEFDAQREKALKAAKASGSDSKELSVLKKEMEAEAKEQIEKLKAEYEGKVTELSTREKELLNQVEDLKGQKLDREIMELITSNIPDDGTAEKNTIELSRNDKNAFKSFIKENLDIAQRSDGVNMFTKKGTDNAFKVKFAGTEITLKTDGSNFKEFFRLWTKENECFRVAAKVVPQTYEKDAQPNSGGGVLKTLEDRLKAGLDAATYKVK